MGRKASNLVGGHYGRWTVLRQSKIKKNGCVCWDCYCDPLRGGCGFLTTPDNPINGAALRAGDSLSCGCLRDENATSAAKDRSLKDRNAAVQQWIEYGVTRSKVAKKFKISKQRVHQIYHGDKNVEDSSL